MGAAAYTSVIPHAPSNIPFLGHTQLPRAELPSPALALFAAGTERSSSAAGSPALVPRWT